MDRTLSGLSDNFVGVDDEAVGTLAYCLIVSSFGEGSVLEEQEINHSLAPLDILHMKFQIRWLVCVKQSRRREPRAPHGTAADPISSN